MDTETKFFAVTSVTRLDSIEEEYRFIDEAVARRVAERRMLLGLYTSVTLEWFDLKKGEYLLLDVELSMIGRKAMMESLRKRERMDAAYGKDQKCDGKAIGHIVWNDIK